jgi:hypothetical protein
LSVSAGGTTASLTSFIIVINAGGDGAELTGLVTVGSDLLGRVPLFNVDLADAGLTAPLSLPKSGKVKIENVALTLTSTAAGALNSVFDLAETSNAFAEGDSVGTAVVDVKVAKKPL